MARTVEYFFSVASPWTFLGHEPFMDLVEDHGLRVVHRPVMLTKVFAETGGLPLPKRHPVRQAYRMMELQRWREKRRVEMNLQPRFVPFDPGLADRAALAMIAAGRDPDPFLRLAFSGVWQREMNLADPDVVAGFVSECGADGARMVEAANGEAARAAYADNERRAVEAGVFGAPSYVLDGEVFWGQDRLDLLADALVSARGPYRPEA